MIKSMTAFARETLETDTESFTWEIRSLNHRYFEVHCRLPETLKSLEPTLREALRSKLSRGKLECSLRIKHNETNTLNNLNVDNHHLNKLKEALTEVENTIGPLRQPTTLDILAWPGVLLTPQESDEEQLKFALLTFENALTQLIESREKEGTDLQKFVQNRIEQATDIVKKIQDELPELLQHQRQQWITRIEEITDEVDNHRLEQELAMMAQKLDIAEEIDRLNTHLSAVNKAIHQNKPVGRRLDFLMQELNREANTLSAKALSISLTNHAVELKVLIEQMREQIQNIE